MNTTFDHTIIEPTASYKKTISPLPTDEETITSLFMIDNDKGGRIGHFVVSDNDYTYYQKDKAIYQIRHIDNSVHKILQTNNRIQNIFLDSYGTLYYHSWYNDNTQGPLYKYTNEKSMLIADNIFNVVRIDDDYLYLNSFDRYDLKNNKYESFVSDNIVPGGIIEILLVKPLMIVRNIKGLGLMDLKTRMIYSIENCRDLSYSISEDGSCFIYENEIGWSKHDQVFLDFEKKAKYTLKMPTFGSIFAIDEKIVLVSLHSNCIYTISKSSGEVLNTVLIHKGLNDHEYESCTFYNDNKIYICISQVQVRDKEDYPSIVNTILYSFNIDTNECQIECSINSLPIEGGELQVDVAGGYYWFYLFSSVNYGEYKYLEKVPIEH